MGHSFIPVEGAENAAGDPAHTSAIKRWTREVLALDENAPITVSELDARCLRPWSRCSTTAAPGNGASPGHASP
jgi:hypothetical protein